MQDKIQKELIIKAPKERIYQAITDPALLVLWFPSTIEGAIQAGEQPVFGFGEHGKNRIYVVDMQPHDYFAYRWVPGSNHFMGDVQSVPNTLVEFRITELDDGSCKVVLTESGFAQFPLPTAEEKFDQNTRGWHFMLDRLETCFLETCFPKPV